ncbi:MAG: DEAD/DEAH box helicase [Proteobacteria bacterium]|nr:DEAD/DEAH box helicase [Pseudomonadota bacterium]
MSFDEFQFHPHIIAGITACGYTAPTPIQREAMPPILAGRDILGLAQTGTGKTAAFVLPLLQRLQAGPRKKIRALIVAPTRELAEQIHENIGTMSGQTRLRSVVVYGGVGKPGQIKKIREGAEIIVACPGRLLDHLNDKAINLREVEVLVLDEADHMFDKGFLPDIRRIMKHLPNKRQNLVFSATMPAEIRHLAEDILNDPATVQINHTEAVTTISHVLFQVTKENKTAMLKSIMSQEKMTTTLIFTKTKHKAKSLALHLEKSGYSATSLQGNLSQQKRQQALDGFKNGTFKVLVATDIAARGIDVSGISHVINYDVPDTVEAYTHRTGRTGRATRTGEALTLAANEDVRMIQTIERTLGKKMIRRNVTGFVADAPCEEPLKTREERPIRKKYTPARSGRNKRTRATSFDFGIPVPAQRQ